MSLYIWMKKMKKILAILFLVLVSLSQQLASSNAIEKKIYTTKRVNPHPPSIDGKLDDPAWEKVEWEGGFIQSKPYEGKEPSQQTAFKILYDDKNIYVAIRAYDTEPKKIEKRMARRDELEGDQVEVSLDSYFDLRTAFAFAVNAAGVKGDSVISEDGMNKDQSWDPIWEVRTEVDKASWNAEMRIPLSQLRFGNKEEHIWGLQITRSLFRKDEGSYWQFIPKDSPGLVHMFGELRGLKGIEAQRQVEILPYTVGKTQSFKRQVGNPFATGRLNNLMAGLDGKIGVTSDLTLDFTINPDFGQIEADPSVINLTAFETYYEEKRPFFIEGKNILSFQIMGGDGDFSSDNLFYSRRIGRSPQFVPQTGENAFLDMPENTSILGAFKLTGKTKSGLSIGILNSLTAKESARISYLGQFSDEIVEPLTNYFGLRLQKDLNQGKTIIGAMATATNRNIKDSHLNFLHDAAYSGGFDFYHSWKNRTYYFSFKALFSHVRGSPEAILRTQESPLRYFQRPDAKHLELDPTRTSLSGHGGTIDFGKGGSGHFMFSTGVTWRSPGLELNDMGYLRYADKIMQWLWVGYRIWEPFSIFRDIAINFNQWKGWDFSWENVFDGGNINLHGQFKNYWSFGMGINRQGEGLQSSTLRGGPSLRREGGWNTSYDLQSDNRKKILLTVGGSSFIRDNKSTISHNFHLGSTYRPNSALTLSFQPFFEIQKEELQYVGEQNFDAKKRYLFAQIDQKTLGLTLRLNCSLTPDLSIQYYGQPFISAGKYSRFRYITNSRAKAYKDRFHIYRGDEISYDEEIRLFHIDEDRNGSFYYSIENPNFNFLEFRSNLVIRWEYRPGSVLFLVWSQGRTGYLSNGNFSFENDFQELFDIHPHNVFLIKISYCFNL